MSSILIGVLLLLIFVGPIVYAIINSKTKKRKVEQLTNKLIAYHGLNPTDLFDSLGNHHFVLDTITKKLLHIEIEKSKITKDNLWNIDDLKSIKAEYSHYTSPSNLSIIDKMYLRVLNNQGQNTEILIYDENTGNMSEVDHLKKALEKLVDRVNSLRA